MLGVPEWGANMAPPSTTHVCAWYASTQAGNPSATWALGSAKHTSSNPSITCPHVVFLQW